MISVKEACETGLRKTDNNYVSTVSIFREHYVMCTHLKYDNKLSDSAPIMVDCETGEAKRYTMDYYPFSDEIGKHTELVEIPKEYWDRKATVVHIASKNSKFSLSESLSTADVLYERFSMQKLEDELATGVIKYLLETQSRMKNVFWDYIENRVKTLDDIIKLQEVKDYTEESKRELEKVRKEIEEIKNSTDQNNETEQDNTAEESSIGSKKKKIEVNGVTFGIEVYDNKCTRIKVIGASSVGVESVNK